MVTKIGDNSDEFIEGTSENDYLDGRGGDDVIVGLGGNDTILGGGGTDLMDGGSGRDRIDYSYYSGGTTIELWRDRAEGSGGNVETIRNFEDATGSQGNDRFEGDEVANRLDGQGGNDRIYGLAGNDTVLGGSGDDILFGGIGADSVLGGSGADVLLGQDGRDTLVGGSGSDRYYYTDTGESSTYVGGDRVIGFEGAGEIGGDRFDLREIDADEDVGGDQSFIFYGEIANPQVGAALGARALWVGTPNGETVLRGNTDDDGTIDFTVRISDGSTVADDYASFDFLLT
jgi:Ca2+-binding RTX toxin-like protein